MLSDGRRSNPHVAKIAAILPIIANFALNTDRSRSHRRFIRNFLRMNLRSVYFSLEKWDSTIGNVSSHSESCASVCSSSFAVNWAFFSIDEYFSSDIYTVHSISIYALNLGMLLAPVAQTHRHSPRCASLDRF